MSASPAGRLHASAEPPAQVELDAALGWRTFPSRLTTLCLVELRKIRHDRTELYTRAIQPVLWLLIFGETMSRLRAIPTEGRPYLDFLAPGIMAQSALFISIFYGIQIIWERDAGILTKLLTTPTSRTALVCGKAFAAGARAVAQVLIVFVVAAILRIGLDWNPLHLLGAVVVVVLGSAFFSLLSVSIAGMALKRDRLMGIGQAITMPLFFASNALYPVELMPGWLRALSRVNPLSYEVDALRGMLLGTTSHIALDLGVLVGATGAAVAVASSLLQRLAR
ncbi:MAG TPA: ABC transporter permease [Candidatus Dormibacteraeota bacterium]